MTDPAVEIKGTVFETFERTAGRVADQPFLRIVTDTARRYGIQSGDISYRDTLTKVLSLSDRYLAAGYGPGHRAAVLLENRPAFFFHWLALNAVGVSVVPLNPVWRANELEYVLAHSEVSIAIVLPHYQAAVRQAVEAIGGSVVVISDQPDDLPRAISPRSSAPAADVTTECALLYTSGTTGRPKGCLLSNAYFLWCGEWYQRLGGHCELHPGQDRLITPLPMYHMNAMAVSTMVMVATGGCVVPLDRFHPSTWWRCVAESAATIVHYLGVMPAMLLGADPEHDVSHQVRFGFGAGVNPSQHEAFETRFGFPLLEAWAMTETGCAAAIIANRRPRKIGTACFGKPPDTLDWRVVGDGGQPAGVGEPGELLVRWSGENPRFGFFDGYLKDDAATAEAWAGGYFHTGDIVYYDNDGSFHFVDRKKNVIRRSGENIAAVEVEAALAAHPDVLAVGVAPVPDDVRGDEVMACIVRKQEVDKVDEDVAVAVVDYCLTRLAYYKVPGYVAFCEALPLTPTEKVQRAELKELALGRLRDGDYVDTRAMKRHDG